MQRERTSFEHFFGPAGQHRLSIPEAPTMEWVQQVCQERAREAGKRPEDWREYADDFLEFLKAIAAVNAKLPG